MRFSVIIPGLIAALAISCLYGSRLNACDIGQNPYCGINENGPAEPSVADNAKSETHAQANSALVSPSKSKRSRLSKSQRRANDAAARDAMAKADDNDQSGGSFNVSNKDKPGKIAQPDMTNIPAHVLAGALPPQAYEYAPLFSVQAAQSAISTLQTIIPVVDPHTLNEIDRMADAGGAAGDAADGGDPLNANPLNAMAAMDMPDAAPSEWRKWLPFGETSVIGQIFIAMGSLLTLATAVRMIIV